MEDLWVELMRSTYFESHAITALQARYTGSNRGERLFPAGSKQRRTERYRFISKLFHERFVLFLAFVHGFFQNSAAWFTRRPFSPSA